MVSSFQTINVKQTPADFVGQPDVVLIATELPDPDSYNDRSGASFRYGTQRVQDVVTVLRHSQLRRDTTSRQSMLASDVQSLVESSAELCVDQFGVAPTVVTLNTNYEERPAFRDVELVAATKSGHIVAEPERAMAAQGELCVADAWIPTLHVAWFDAHATDFQQMTVVQLLDAGGDVFAQLDSTGQSYALDEAGERTSPMTPELFWAHAEFLRQFH